MFKHFTSKSPFNSSQTLIIVCLSKAELKNAFTPFIPNTHDENTVITEMYMGSLGSVFTLGPENRA